MNPASPASLTTAPCTSTTTGPVGLSPVRSTTCAGTTAACAALLASIMHIAATHVELRVDRRDNSSPVIRANDKGEGPPRGDRNVPMSYWDVLHSPLVGKAGEQPTALFSRVDFAHEHRGPRMGDATVDEVLHDRG